MGSLERCHYCEGVTHRHCADDIAIYLYGLESGHHSFFMCQNCQFRYLPHACFLWQRPDAAREQELALFKVEDEEDRASCAVCGIVEIYAWKNLQACGYCGAIVHERCGTDTTPYDSDPDLDTSQFFMCHNCLFGDQPHAFQLCAKPDLETREGR